MVRTVSAPAGVDTRERVVWRWTLLAIITAGLLAVAFVTRWKEIDCGDSSSALATCVVEDRWTGTWHIIDRATGDREPISAIHE